MATVKVLVVAWGGGGGTASDRTGWGWGAGWVIYDDAFALAAWIYSVTVWGGGSANSNWSNSSFSTITSTWGWRGGRRSGGDVGDGGNGGSGWGAMHNGANKGLWTAGQGNDGATWYDSGNPSLPFTAGGGGGATQVGGTGTSGWAGKWGDGLSNSITGTSVTYGGGGGGGAQNSTAWAGGSGGGGAWSRGTWTAGTANLGGGGGGGGSGGAWWAGGSWVVIVSYLTGTATATGWTITTSGGYTIHTFNSSGTFELTEVGDSKFFILF